MKARAGVARELPILFSAAMVLALLAGRKWQTRRIPPRELWDDERSMLLWGLQHFGGPGDVLYVREAWRTSAALDGWSPRQIFATLEPPLRYEADGRGRRTHAVRGGWGRQRPGIFLPKAGSRIHRVRTEPLRVEHVQDISEADILAEGVTPDLVAEMTGEPLHAFGAPRDAWRVGWDHLNGKRGGWAENPPLIVVPLGEEARAC
jgi:hypothetical protein